jgi:hypothetical protein
MDPSFPSTEARAAYIRSEALDMLQRGLSYAQRREELARARWRQMQDFGKVGPHTLLLEDQVRLELNHLLKSVVIQCPIRTSLWMEPDCTQKLLTYHVTKEPMAHPFLILGTDGTQTSSCRFDDLEPPLRFNSICLVAAIRPCEQDNKALLFLGALSKESKNDVERVALETRVEVVARSLGLEVMVLIDGGFFYKWVKRRARCGFDFISKASVADDVGTTLHPKCKATAEDWEMLLCCPTANIVGGLLHGLCTILLRIRKTGMSNGERAVLDAWFLKMSGRALCRDKKDTDNDETIRDGKLEIEKFDMVMAKLVDAKLHMPQRWHPSMDRLFALRHTRILPTALVVLSNIHLAFIKHTTLGWSLGCHFVAHTLHFAVTRAKGDLWIVHEQLVERANQIFKKKAKFWSGDAPRVMQAHNATVCHAIIPCRPTAPPVPVCEH